MGQGRSREGEHLKKMTKNLNFGQTLAISLTLQEIFQKISGKC